MLISQLLNELHQWAPFNYQESYDNSGLLVGSPDSEVQKILVSLDITEEVMAEAIKLGSDLIISHHPIIFQGLKSLTGKTPEERVVITALKNDIAIIAMHTNLDNVSHGVNAKIAEVLELKDTQILSPKAGLLKKVVVFVPSSHLTVLRLALFEAGAGHIGEYDACSFTLEGIGSFRAGQNAQPYVGDIGSFHQEKEARLELVFPAHLQSKISETIISKHPYEEPAFDFYSLDNKYQKIGAGVLGTLENDKTGEEFLVFLKEKMQTHCIRHTILGDKKIKRIAVGTKVPGKVSNIADYGCFVEIEDGVEGLVHVSEMDWTNKNVNPSKFVTLGQETEVMILDIDEERRRISLGMKQCQDNPWASFAVKFQKNDKVTGNIKSITDFGIFVGLDGGIDGLIHLSDLSWSESGEELVRNFKKGQEIEAMVLAIDPERERVSLGVKQMDKDPFSVFVTSNPKGSTVNGTVISVDAKAAVVDLGDGVEGTLRASELSRERVEDATTVLSVGDAIEAKFIGLDKKSRNLNLSIKAKDSDDEKRVISEYSTESTSGTSLGDLLKEKMGTSE